MPYIALIICLIVYLLILRFFPGFGCLITVVIVLLLVLRFGGLSYLINLWRMASSFLAARRWENISNWLDGFIEG
jgi:hypothetical protein